MPHLSSVPYSYQGRALIVHILALLKENFPGLSAQNAVSRVVSSIVLNVMRFITRIRHVMKLRLKSNASKIPNILHTKPCLKHASVSVHTVIESMLRVKDAIK